MFYAFFVHFVNTILYIVINNNYVALTVELMYLWSYIASLLKLGVLAQKLPAMASHNSDRSN